jgi:hypothetical protein
MERIPQKVITVWDTIQRSGKVFFTTIKMRKAKQLLRFSQLDHQS